MYVFNNKKQHQQKTGRDLAALFSIIPLTRISHKFLVLSGFLPAICVLGPVSPRRIYLFTYVQIEPAALTAEKISRSKQTVSVECSNN